MVTCSDHIQATLLQCTLCGVDLELTIGVECGVSDAAGYVPLYKSFITGVMLATRGFLDLIW